MDSYIRRCKSRRNFLTLSRLLILVSLFEFSESFATPRATSDIRHYFHTAASRKMSDSETENTNRIPGRFDTTLRSSSLGEESDTNYFQESDKKSSSEPTTTSAPPKFSVGVIADIQYAPVPDGSSFSGQPRFYRHSLEVARHAFEHFEKEKVDLVLNLGDILDGKCQDIEGNGGDPGPDSVDPGIFSLDHVLDALSPYKSGRTIHSYGNHCLYNLDRETLGERIGIDFVKEPCGDLVGYSSHVHQGVRFVVIDSYDIALLRRCRSTSQKYQQAKAILGEKNPNFPGNSNSPEGLTDLERRFVGFGGGVGPRQLEWLKKTLDEARTAQEKVVIVSHQPIAPASSNPVCLIWNYDEVLEILRANADVVVASFSGHAHKGGYVRDTSGIHFRVFEAALENRPERTYAIVDIHDNQLVVRGYGNCESSVYDYDHVLQET
jgi:manganese-dependent ADP-ribose/CDP-alcohol diphosphatase